MKKLRSLSTLLCIAMVICLLQPVAYAAEEVGDVTATISGKYAVYSFENSEKLYNIIVLRESGQIQFALIRQTEPDICYEYVFDLPTNLSVESATFWDSIRDVCFDNEANWNHFVISESIQVIDHSTSNISTFAADPYLAYFEEWLVKKNGAEWAPLHFTNKIVDGIDFSWDYYRRHDVSKNYTYLITQTVSVVGLISAVLGLFPTAGLNAAIGLIASATGFFLSGTKVYQYKLRTISSYVMTANGGTYPYSKADKHISYTGYVYSETGNWAVDTDSLKQYYDPSEEYYLSFTQQLNAAYENYLTLGDMG